MYRNEMGPDFKYHKRFNCKESIDELIEEMNVKESNRQEAYYDAVHVIANRLTQIQRDILYY